MKPNAHNNNLLYP